MDEHADARRAMYWAVPVSQDLRPHWQPHCGVAGLVIAIALAEEWSGAAYSILIPDAVPRIEMVPHIAERPLPTVLSPNTHTVEDGHLFRDWDSIWHTLDAHRSPRDPLRLRFDNAVTVIPPPEKQRERPEAKQAESTFEQAVVPLFRHMAAHTSKYMQQRHINGYDVIQRHGDTNVRYVICTPHRIHEHMQAQLRNACVRAGLIPPIRAHTVVFVSHTQAVVSAYAALPGGYADTWPTRLDDVFVVCDVQHDSVKLSSYCVTSATPLNVKQAQSTWRYGSGDDEHTLEEQARSLLRYRLAGTPWDNDVDIDDLVLRLLDVCSFASFANDDDDDGGADVCVQFAPSSKYNDAQLGVRRGKLTFSRHEIRALFLPVVMAIEQKLRHVCRHHPARPLHVVAVGAFTERSDLFRTLQQRMAERVILCSTPASCEHNRFESVVTSGAIAWLLRSWGG